MLHIAYNMIAFATIFIAFGIFMFYMIRSITFSETDKQLRETKTEFADIQTNLETLYQIFDLGNLGLFKNNALEYNIAKRVNNPQITFILRNENGKILNPNDLGKLTNYSDDITFTIENLDSIYALKLDDTLSLIHISEPTRP